MDRGVHSSLALDVYTPVASEDDVRFAEQLDGILRPNAPKKENGSGLEHPKPLFLKLTNGLQGPATPRNRHSLILPYRFELIRDVAA
jgi:hypothetical protein